MSIFERIFDNARAQIGSFYHAGEDFDFDAFDTLFENEEFQQEFQEEQQSHQNDFNKELADCYATLEIPFGSGLEITRNAWKTMMKKYHPDKHSNNPEKLELATKISVEVTASYKFIENYLKNKK
ncbi:MAG: J domain-containing protein [Nitrospinae bacterium]|nr:J domain-containing protein [Nitrospinota bacterium]